MIDFGGNIRRLRQEAGVTQTELARRVCITQSMLCQIERGTKACSMALGAEIAAALERDITALYSTTKEAKS